MKKRMVSVIFRFDVAYLDESESIEEFKAQVEDDPGIMLDNYNFKVEVTEIPEIHEIKIKGDKDAKC